MPDAIPDETRLQAEIERLKAEFPKTRDLYREACALLFFRFGVTPTANRLYQLVKRGSMSTPVAVLTEFWAELREKSRVRIEHADLPEDLQGAAGELVAALWKRAAAAAQASLETLRREVEDVRLAAEATVATMRADLERTEAALAQRTAALLAGQIRVQELEQAQAATEATRGALEGEIARLHQEGRERDAALAQARTDFAAELEKLRASCGTGRTRLQAAEKRALLEIERERATSARLVKERDAVARRAEHSEARLHADVQVLQTQLGDARQQIGVLEGSLDAVRRANAGCVEELKALRQQGLASVPGGTAGRAGRRRGEAMASAARRLARSAGKSTVRKKST